MSEIYGTFLDPFFSIHGRGWFLQRPLLASYQHTVPGWARTTILSVNSRARYPIAPQRLETVLLFFFKHAFGKAQYEISLGFILKKQMRTNMGQRL